MFGDFLLSFGQLGDRRMRRPLWIGLAGSVAILVMLVAAANALLFSLSYVEWRWLDWLLKLLGGGGSLLLAWLLFPAVATVLQSFFLEEVAAAVEGRHYPGQPPPRVQPWGETIWATLRFLALVVAINLLMLPLYLLALFIPPLSLLLSCLVNGYLLGREYFELVAFRRLDARAVKALGRARRGRIWLTGMAMAFLFAVPIVNLVMPVLATAMMVHRFERFRRALASPPSGASPVLGLFAALPLAALAVACAPVHQEVGAPPAPAARIASPPAAAETSQPPVEEKLATVVPAPPANPRDLLGLKPDAVSGKLGQPGFVRREGPARIWQYAGPDCVFDVYLYRDAADFRVTHVEARGRRGGQIAAQGCYEALLRARPEGRR
ncbi:MAG: hypothetical protein EXQ87_06615 [Alphaproteobacteria bacterium]|nr:hypothetical protein [Alphaproteobacteria bacterium]